jgi:ribonuclease HI
MPSLFDSSEKPATDRQDILVAFVDGGARGNPGPSGYGVYLQDANGKCIDELSEFLGIRTNNFAEYSALLAALRYALEHDFTDVRVVSDSELMVKQIKGQYKVNSPDLRPLYEEAKQMIRKLNSFQIRHVLRGQNKEADRLANLAMDRGSKKGSSTPASPVRANAYERKPEPPKTPSAAIPQELDGVVRDGVVEVYGHDLPEGTKVKIRVIR